LPDAFCKNTGHFDLSAVPDLSYVLICMLHRENRETIIIVKPQLIICLYSGHVIGHISILPVFWLAHYISLWVWAWRENRTKDRVNSSK